MAPAENFSLTRSGLFRRYAAVLMGLVGGALVLQGLLEMGFAYRESLQAAARVQHAEVRAAADRIHQYFTGLERASGRAASLAPPSGGLRFVGDVVDGVAIGRHGHVYAVDARDRLVAHPDHALLANPPDLAAQPALRRIREEIAQSGDSVAMFRAPGLAGGDMMISAARVPASQWLVIAEQPRDEILAPLYQTLARTLWVMGAGLLAALTASYLLARRLVRPIFELRGGAERIAGGELATRIRIDTGDEVEALALEFNRMADQLQDYTTGLERKVAEKTAELEMANRHKSEFLANMSHELRTPLNAIIGFSEVLKERMFGELNPKQLEYVRDIYGSGQHLLSLINDILDLTKVEAGHMELDARDFSVRSAIHNCCTLIRERALRKRLRLESHVFEDVGNWRADERKFKQVVLNLLSNAVKFTPSGGEVRIVARIEGDTLVVAVSDTGVGVAPEDQERIFHSFQQVASDEEVRREGSGLGLALSRRLVERHGGTLVVASTPGRGATFVARFPRLPVPEVMADA
jgi:signal transduction histidine kinase